MKVSLGNQRSLEAGPGETMDVYGYRFTVQDDLTLIADIHPGAAAEGIRVGRFFPVMDAPELRSFESYIKAGDLDRLREEIESWRKDKYKLRAFAKANFNSTYPPRTPLDDIANDILAEIDKRCE